MVNGRIAQELPAAELAADRGLQERLLGVRAGERRGGRRAAADACRRAPTASRASSRCAAPTPKARRRSTRRRRARCAASTAGTPATPRRRWPTSRAPSPRAALTAAPSPAAPPREPQARAAQVFDFPVAASSGRAAYVAGTFDTKGRELYFLRQCLEKLGLRVVTVDLSTSGKPSTAAVHPREVARHHPAGRVGGLQRRPRQRRHGDGARLRALRRDPRRPRRPDLAPAARAARRSPPPACARCRSACPR